MFKYSIVMPVYNTGIKLKKSIESIVNQTYSNWELIIIDDGSTDDSFEIISKFAHSDNRIKVFKQKNQGPGIARNNGIKKCSGDYIGFLDSDDYYDYNFLETINEENKQSEKDIIYIGDIKEFPNGKKFGGYNFKKYANYSKENLLRLQIMGTIPWGGVLKVVKSQIVKKCSYSQFEVGEELIYSVNILLEAEKISILDKEFYHYVHNENGQHTRGGYDPWCEMVDGLTEFLKSKKIFNKYKKEVNSLALKALSISIYRYSYNNHFLTARKHIKEMIEKYNNNYNIYDINYSFLDKTSKVVQKLIHMKCYFILYVLSKIKRIKSKG